MSRDQSIDFVRGIAIIAVTVGHVIGSYTFGYSWLSYWVYSFELPSFFFLSGWVQQMRGNKKSIKAYILSSCKSVLYPYLTFSILYIIIFTLIEIVKGGHDLIKSIVSNVFYTVTLYGLGALWFMPTFFLATILAYVLWKVCCRYSQKEIGLVIAIVATVIIGSLLSAVTIQLKYWNDTDGIGYSLGRCVTWWYLSLVSRSVVCSSLVLVGRALYIVNERFSAAKKMLRGYWEWLFAVILITIGAVLGLMQPNVVDLHFSFIYNPVLFYLSSICTVLGLMIVGKKISLRVVRYLGRYSMIVMACQLVQQFTCRIVNKIIDKFGYASSVIYVGVSICTIAFVLLCSLIAIQIINKNKLAHCLVEPPRSNKHID